MNRFLRLNKKLILGLLFAFLLITAVGIPSQPAYGYIDDADKKPALNSKPVEFTPQVTIPGSSFQAGVTSPLEASTGPIARYISAIYNYGVGIVGILAAMMLMIGGIIWLTAAGSSSKIEQAKSFIGSSLTGMALVLTAYILLNTINPDLVNLRTTTVTSLEELKCCQLSGAAVMTYPKECEKNNGQVKSLDYLVSLDNKTCEKGGCCINLKIPASVSGVIVTLFSSDMMSQTKLTYKASLPINCNTGMSFPTTAVLTARLFGSQETTVFTAASCTEVQDNTCNGQADATKCLGKTRLGYCYHGKCYAGQGEKGDHCGTDPGSTCIKESVGNDCNQNWGGMGCVSGLWCCKGTLEVPTVVCSSPGSENNSCKVGSGGFGYCFQGTCIPCARYYEECNTEDNSQCPDQEFNEQTNPTQQCGDNANDNNGDCSSYLGSKCTAPSGYCCDKGDD